MRFREFMVESEEVRWGFFGGLVATLGGNQSERLNYGTAPAYGKDAMLYVPIIRGQADLAPIIASVRRTVAKTGIQCDSDPTAFGGWRCGAAANGHKADLMHTGESHVTVAHARELEPLFNGRRPVDVLQNIRLKSGEPLFGPNGLGIEMPVRPTSKIIYGIAKAFKGQPLVALLQVDCPRVSEVRAALGLKALPSGYKFHVSVGYAFGKWTDTTATTARDNFVDSARQQHNAGFLRSLPEEFHYLGEIIWGAA